MPVLTLEERARAIQVNGFSWAQVMDDEAHLRALAQALSDYAHLRGFTQDWLIEEMEALNQTYAWQIPAQEHWLLAAFCHFAWVRTELL